MTSRLVKIIILASIAITPVFFFSSIANARPAQNSSQQLISVQKQVESLNAAAEYANEQYNEQYEIFNSLVMASSTASQQLQEAQHSADEQYSERETRIRGLYMAGGQLALLNSLSGTYDLGFAAEQLSMSHWFFADDDHNIAQANQQLVATAQSYSRVKELVRKQVAVKQEAEKYALKAQQLLAEKEKVLSSVTNQVRAQIQARQPGSLSTQENSAIADRQARVQLSADSSSLAPNSIAAAAVKAAYSVLGSPYVFGAEGPDTFDCSGLVQWAYGQAGLALPRTARPQYRETSPIGFTNLLPGDLLFWASNITNPETIYHVAIYIGHNQIIAAPEPGDVVKIQKIYFRNFIGATRPRA